MTSPAEVPETYLYEKIVAIPHYESNYWKILDREDEEGVVEDSLDEFRSLYQPIITQTFKDYCELSADGTVRVEQSLWARKEFASKINDNVLRNIDQFSVVSYDSDQKRHKDALTPDQRNQVVSKLLESGDTPKQLDKAIDKILKAHRNTKILLFMLTGPFLFFF